MDELILPRMETVKRTAAISGLSQRYIRDLCRTGKVPFVVVGNKWLVNLDKLKQFLDSGDTLCLPQNAKGKPGVIRRVEA